VSAHEAGISLSDVGVALRRRRWPALALFVLLLGGAVAALRLQPDEFRSESTLLLEPYRPHPELVTPAVTTLLEERLRVARQQLLSGPNLMRVVREQRPLRPVAGWESASTTDPLSEPASVAALRKRLEVRPDGESAVIVAYRTPQRDEAAPVLDAVVRGFVEANAALRVSQAQRVVQVLDGELHRVRASLDGAESQVASYRRAHDGELPDQLEANLREAERHTRLMDGAQLWLRELERRRSSLPLQATSAELERVGVARDDLTRQLNHALSVYAGEHPEPVRLGRELEGVRSWESDASARAAANMPGIAQLAAERRRTQGEVAQLSSRVRSAAARARAAAGHATTLASLERERDVLRAQYQAVAARRSEAEVALGLERLAAPHATAVVDPASEPLLPAGPDRLRLSLVALLLALVLSTALAVWLEARDRTVRSAAQLRRSVPVPVLAVVPDLRARG